MKRKGAFWRVRAVVAVLTVPAGFFLVKSHPKPRPASYPDAALLRRYQDALQHRKRTQAQEKARSEVFVEMDKKTFDSDEAAVAEEIDKAAQLPDSK